MELGFAVFITASIFVVYYFGLKRGTMFANAIISDLISRGLISRNEETGAITYASKPDTDVDRALGARLTTIEELIRALYQKQIGVPIDDKVVADVWYERNKA